MTTFHPTTPQPTSFPGRADSSAAHGPADAVAGHPALLDLRTEPSPEQIQRHLRFANEVARRAAAAGHHPFGAILVGPDHETVLIEQGNIDTVNHAEAVLARLAARSFTAEELWGCTLYTTVEPCCMCAGTHYWAHIGRLVYGMDESRLLDFTGSHVENPTMNLPCREVFAHGQKTIRVTGPVAEVEAEIAALHVGFWRTENRGDREGDSDNHSASDGASASENARASDSGSDRGVSVSDRGSDRAADGDRDNHNGTRSDRTPAA